MTDQSQSRRRQYLICVLLAAITLVVYWQALGHSFIRYYDDDDYIVKNSHVQAGLTAKSIAWAFTATHASNWHPLTWMSHMLDCQLYGLSPTGHHLTSLLFHIANVLLLFLLLTRMTGFVWRSAFVAALFAIHPLHVESVAWVPERKDVLSALLGLLTLWAYVRYAERPQLRRYLLVAFFFALGLMAKPMLVTLPILLLLLDYWPLGRLSRLTTKTGSWIRPALRLALEKAPLIALTAASCAATIVAQHRGGAVVPLERLAPSIRAANAVVAYVSYLGKMIWPHRMSVFYPHPGNTLQAWQIVGSLLLLVCITVLVLRFGRRHPYLAAGWLWYVTTLVPVIGLVQVGAQAMADRYTYVPLIGVFIIVAWGVPDLVLRPREAGKRTRGRATARPKRPYAASLAATAALVILALMIVAWFQVSYWRNTETLFAHAIDVTTDNAMAHNNLAAALDDQGKTEEAIAHYREAIRINPNYADAHNNLGIALGSRGDIDEAIEHYEKALTRKPDDPDINCNIGVALAATGRLDEAVVHFTKALRVAPGSVRAHYSLGLALAQQGRGAKAIPHFREVLRLSPKNPQAANDLAWLLATNPDEKLRNGAEAVQLAERACRMTDFRNPGTLDTLAAAYAEDGRFEDALATARKALTLAVSSGPPGLAEELRKRLRLYEKRQPFHQAARAVRSP